MDQIRSCVQQDRIRNVGHFHRVTGRAVCFCFSSLAQGANVLFQRVDSTVIRLRSQPERIGSGNEVIACSVTRSIPQKITATRLCIGASIALDLTACAEVDLPLQESQLLSPMSMPSGELVN